jgi:hypothetical protein
VLAISPPVIDAIVRLIISHHDEESGLAILRLFQGSCTLWVSRLAADTAINFIEPDMLPRSVASREPLRRGETLALIFPI